jgi:hypothetical protein
MMWAHYVVDTTTELAKPVLNCRFRGKWRIETLFYPTPTDVDAVIF